MILGGVIALAGNMGPERWRIRPVDVKVSCWIASVLCDGREDFLRSSAANERLIS